MLVPTSKNGLLPWPESAGPTLTTFTFHLKRNGFLCTKVSKYLERTYHDDRPALSQIPRPPAKMGEEEVFSGARAWDEGAVHLIRGSRRNGIICPRPRGRSPSSLLPYSVTARGRPHPWAKNALQRFLVSLLPFSRHDRGNRCSDRSTLCCVPLAARRGRVTSVR